MRRLVLALLMVVGCAPIDGDDSAVTSTDYRIVLDPAMGQDVEVSLRSAAKQWEAAIPGLSMTVYVGTTSAKSHHNTILIRPSPPNPNDPAENAWTNRSAIKNSSDIGVIVLGHLGTEILAHELGHAMGLGHADRGLMMVSGVEGESVTCREAKAFCAVWANRMPSCYCALTSPR